MKRFIKIVSVICLFVFLSLSFVGCNDPKKEDKFYEQTNLSFNTFITEVCKNPKYTNGLQYGPIVTDILNKIKTDETFKAAEYKDKMIVYSQLTDIYDKIFINSFIFLASFENVFDVTNPEKITGDTKKQYLAFEQSLANVKDNIENISTAVEEMEIGIRSSNLADVTSDISLQVVREFKRKYIDLSQELINVCNEFLNLIENYIYPKYDSYKNGENYIDLTQTQLVNQRTIVALKSAVNTLTPAINYLNDFNGDYVTLNTDKFFTTLDKYISLNVFDETTITIQELQYWKEVFDAFVSDTQNFYVSLEKINLPEYRKEYDCNIDKYLEDYPQNIAYINKIITFSNETVLRLYYSLQDLCK